MKKHLYRIALALLGCLAILSDTRLNAASPESLQLRPGDHLALIGSALADRMQHSGHFETLLHASLPEHRLVVRNLAVAGDEVVTRHRSENFGSPDDWLRKVQADVIIAFFGFNESFQGDQGLPRFREDLGRFIEETRAKSYSEHGQPRLVLVSPIAAERHQDPNFPNPLPINQNLRAYTAAMADVARAHEILFVDLFHPSLDLYAEAARSGQSLTINGLHLSPEGDRRVAPILFKALFGSEPPQGDFDRLLAAVNQKNREWHARYRTVDGYNVYGGRSALAYQPDKGGFISDRNAPEPYISNFRVMQQEMSQRDVLTANRDLRVWAVARGSDHVIDDSNLPPVQAVASNKPGPNPDGSHVFLGGEEAIARMTVHSGMQVNLYADEVQFPDLVSPVQMAWDTRGRLWVAAWLNYPERTPTSKEGDKLLVFEDTNHDGRADRVTTFLDDLNCPTGFQFYRDGVLVVQAPDVWFVRDTDGDGRADWKERILMGLDSADSHHTANALCHDPGGAIYLSDGVFHRTQVETALGPVRNNDAAIYRFEPRTGRFETYIPYGFANPHGRVFDRWGNDLVTDATGNNTYFGPAISGRLNYPAKHPGIRQFWERPSRPCPGTGMISSRHFPTEFQGNFLNCNVIGFQGIFRVKVTEEGSGLAGETLEHLVSSSDPNFRPSAVNVGPDGALYFLDWHKPLIGHMQHHIRDANRDQQHGRIYRITYTGRPLLQPKPIHGQPIPALLELLREPEDGVRELAKVELGSRDSNEVIAATRRWVAALNTSDPDHEHHLLEALWVHQWHNVLNMDLLGRMLASPEPRARAAAGRVLCLWRDRIPPAEVLGLFRKLAEDEHPRVRLEAVRGASYFDNPEAAEIAVAALKRPLDYYLDYTLKETLRQLEPWWRQALSEGRLLAADNPAGLKYLLQSVATSSLLKLPRNPAVLDELLHRPGLTDSDRSLALMDLASHRQAPRASVLMDLLDQAGSNLDDADGLIRLLPLQLPDELDRERPRLTRLASSGPSPLRPAAWVALAAADDSFDSVWSRALRASDSLTDLVSGIPLLNDPQFRARAFDRVRPLIARPEIALGTESGRSKPGGQFVRIELPRRGTLTLAEVQVFSDGINIAPRGTPSQSSTSNGGTASRAIDGRTDGDFASGSQTHTRENDRRPWWELDLGREFPIEAVTIWNRRDGDLGKRLDGFTLSVLDASRQPVFQQAELPAPVSEVRVPVHADPAGRLRRAAILALTSMGTEPETTFRELASLIGRNLDVSAASAALRTLPRASWPKDQAASATTAMLAWAKNVPVGERTREDYLQVLQTAGDLAGLLPPSEAETARRDLRDLRVAVFVIRTVREQMRYDTPRLVVEAGKPFEIILQNDDFMPHNLVVVKPGGRERVGPVAETMSPEKLDRQGRAFIPDSLDILAATPLLEAGMRTTLKLVAPEIEGDYEYVCTFPGHWPVMWGWLIVTRDVDAYLQKHPVAPEHPVPAEVHHHGLE